MKNAKLPRLAFLRLKPTKNTMLLSTSNQTLTQDIRLFTLFMGLAILTYLMPWHSPLGRDFVVNATAFGFVSLAIAAFFWQNPITKFSKSVLTWLLLALLIVCQPLFNHIAYPCLLYTSPSPRDLSTSRMPSSA